MKNNGILLAVGAALSLTSSIAIADDAMIVREIKPGILEGYLPQDAIDSAFLLPPPPALGSAALALDLQLSQAALALRNTPRWKLAAMDAVLSFPAAADHFACALDAPISSEDTPRLYQLLRRVETDAGRAADGAKEKYKRARPFMVDDAATCTPDAEDALRKNGSYPSGHTTMGWTWALVLAEVAPDRANAILARGRSYGESRVVCHVHWPSDVIEGRFVADATVARLHGEEAFRADVEAAKAELAAERTKGLTPKGDCKFEADAIAQTPPLSP